MRLGEDDIALCIECGLRDHKLAGDLAHQHQRGIDGCRVVLRHVEGIDGLRRRGEGVGVGAEGEAQALQLLDHVAVGHMRRTSERHVLEHMGDALLVVPLHQRAGGDAKAERHRALGRGVVLDRIAHAVGQRAETHRGIGRQVAPDLGPRLGRRRLRSGGGCDEEESGERGEHPARMKGHRCP